MWEDLNLQKKPNLLFHFVYENGVTKIHKHLLVRFVVSSYFLPC